MFCVRSLVPETEGADCNFEEVQHKPCDPGRCPALCLLYDQELSLGDTWLQGECEQWWGWKAWSWFFSRLPKKRHYFEYFLHWTLIFPSSICTPEGVYCQDIDCRGRSWSVSMSEHSRTESAVVMWSTLVCVSSRWRLDALVSVVWLFCDLWRGHAGSDPCMYQPPTTEQWIGLQRTGQKNPGLPDASMFRFVHSGENVLLKPVRKIQNTIHFYWLLVT